MSRYGTGRAICESGGTDNVLNKGMKEGVMDMESMLIEETGTGKMFIGGFNYVSVIVLM